ncbi:MAG TPA: hypothetical protein VKT81_24800 [Bryobacteraceae bacterium]|nr:hypothetical protein [Bryobacteraceae bacterium]
MRTRLSIVALSVALSWGAVDRAFAQQSYAFNITSVFGQYPLGDQGPATKALLSQPFGVALDGNGNLYIPDSLDNRIRKVVILTGQITTVAGNGISGFAGDGGPATAAEISDPAAVALDSSGNLYIYDTGNEVIRKVDASGNISTVVGTPFKSGATGDGGLANAATLNLHAGGGLAFDKSNNLYIADVLNSAIRMVNATTGKISTFAGTIGKYGNAGDGGAATSAQLTYPFGIAFDPAGNLFISDAYVFAIREVSAKDGTIKTIAGTPGKPGYAGDGGPAASALMSYPYDLATDSQGNVYFADLSNNVIRKVTVGSTPPTISTIAGNQPLGPGFAGDGGSAVSAQLNTPVGVAYDSAAGTLYISDFLNARIRQVTGGTIGEFAGADHAQGDGGLASAAYLYFPQDVAEDSAGNFYIADTFNNEIRKVTKDGKMSTLAKIPSPNGVAADSSGNVYVSHSHEVVKIDSTGKVTTIAGTASKSGFSGDGGPATAALLNTPFGLWVDSNGNVFVADCYNHRIRKISLGNITTVAGSGGTCGSTCNFGGATGDGGLATSATMSFPTDVKADAAGNLYIADSANSRVRKVDTGGNMNTLAGGGPPGGSGGDGGSAQGAKLNTPYGVAVDASGDVFITDSINQAIRMVDAFGNIYTVAGNGKPGFSGDGGAATSAMMYKPFGIITDPNGNVFFVDSLNHRVRELTGAGPSVPSGKSVVNAASFVNGGLVPGGMATIFGSNLTSATGINLASGLPLATDLLKVEVKFNNVVSAPIFAVDNVNNAEQINIQVPWELAGQSSVLMQVFNNGVASLPVSVPVLAAQPGIFQYNVGDKVFGVVLHANFQLADSAHPVTGGETVLVYCTNLGAVTPALKDGQAGTGAEITNIAPTATLNKENAAVSFHGTAPGFVGLYQVNIVIPKDAKSGNQPLVLTSGGASSQTVLLPVK